MLTYMARKISECFVGMTSLLRVTHLLVLDVEFVLRILDGLVHHRAVIQAHVVTLLLEERRQLLLGFICRSKERLQLNPQGFDSRVGRIR